MSATSRIDPEGFPNTILEGLSSRSPLNISDHPAFRDPSLYADLSERSEGALDGAYFGMGWTELVGTFVDDPADRTGWVARNSLAALDA